MLVQAYSGGINNPRMIRQSEVVIGAEIQEGFPVDGDVSSLGRGYCAFDLESASLFDV